MAKYVKKEEIAGKHGYLIEPGDENKIDTMKKGCRIGWRRGWRHRSATMAEMWNIGTKIQNIRTLKD